MAGAVTEGPDRESTLTLTGKEAGAAGDLALPAPPDGVAHAPSAAAIIRPPAAGQMRGILLSDATQWRTLQWALRNGQSAQRRSRMKESKAEMPIDAISVRCQYTQLAQWLGSVLAHTGGGAHEDWALGQRLLPSRQ